MTITLCRGRIAVRFGIRRRKRIRSPGLARSPSRSGRAAVRVRSSRDTQLLAERFADASEPACFSQKGPIKSVITSGLLAGFESPRLVITSLAGFPGAGLPHRPGRRTDIPAAFRYAPRVSRRTPVACSMRRSVKPSLPSAMTCCFFSSFKTLLMSAERIRRR